MERVKTRGALVVLIIAALLAIAGFFASPKLSAGADGTEPDPNAPTVFGGVTEIVTQFGGNNDYRSDTLKYNIDTGDGYAALDGQIYYIDGKTCSTPYKLIVPDEIVFNDTRYPVKVVRQVFNDNIMAYCTSITIGKNVRFISQGAFQVPSGGGRLAEINFNATEFNNNSNANANSTDEVEFKSDETKPFSGSLASGDIAINMGDGVALSQEMEKLFDELPKKVIIHPDDHDDNDVYIIPVKLVYGSFTVSEPDVHNRLHKKEFSYYQQADGSWIDGGNAMPIAKGFDAVDWYTNGEYTGDKVTQTMLNGWLNDPTTLTTYALYDKSIVLFGDTLQKPVADGEYKVTYTGAEYTLDGGENGLFKANTGALRQIGYIETRMKIEITDYRAPDQAAAASYAMPYAAVPQTVCDAGTYTLTISPKNGSDSWTPVTFELVVEQREINLNELVAWEISTIGGVSANVQLGDAKLYIYNESGVDVPYLVEQSGTATVREVKESYVRHSGKQIELKLKDNEVEYYGVSYTARTGTDIGVYTAEAEIELATNYKATFTGGDLAARGIKIESIASSARKYKVTKTWYIVEMPNYLIVGGGDSSDYTIAESWEYYANSSFIPVAPELLHDNDSGVSAITFSLSLGGSKIAENVAVADFAKYFNNVMPAGKYRVSFTVSQVVGGGITYPEFETPIEFTVLPKALPAAVKAIADGLKGKSYVHKADNAPYFFDAAARAALEGLADLTVQPTATERQGTVWADAKYNGYYKGFEITYNLLRMASNNYYAESWFAESSYAPKTPDTYNIYYQISAPSYAPLADVSAASRLDYVFTTVIYYELDTPKILTEPTYTGSRVLPTVAPGERYVVELIEDDNYTDGGTHKIRVKIYDPEHYRWKEPASGSGITLDGDNNEYAVIPFTIAPAQNSWSITPGIPSWAAGEFDPEFNIVEAAAAFGEYRVVITDAENNVVYDSKEGINELAGLPVGVYTITATGEATANYAAPQPYSATFRVFPPETEKGFPWWAVLIIVLGVLLIVALILFILYKKEVFQMVTEKMVAAIRTRADADATIAAVKAGKVAAAAEAARAAEEAALAAEDAASDAEEAENIDDDADDDSYVPLEDDAEVASTGNFAKAFAAVSAEEYTYSRSVLSKLIKSPDVVKNRYSELKNYLLGYKKARSNMSRARESYYVGRKCYARISMRGKTLCLYLATDPAKYAGSKYNVEDLSEVKSYADTPCMLRIKSDRAVRFAKELIDELMAELGEAAVERKSENYALLFKNIEELEKKRLIGYIGNKRRVK